jgi:Na+-transporting NADH:ubiquinone oxidoreductase subunit B
VFQKQQIMRKVLYSLIPIFLYSAYLYGWRVVAVTAVVFGVGILSEFIMEKARNKKVSEAVLVTSALLALSFPPAVPLWVAALAAAFSVVMGKGVYGGFGRNVFNPAITGRLFTYLSFPLLMQTTWMIPGAFGTLGMNAQAQGSGFVEAIFMILIVAAAYWIITNNYEKKGLVRWTIFGAIGLTVALYVISAYAGILAPEVDAVSTVTPLEIFRGLQSDNLPAGSEYINDNSLTNLFFGRRVGSMGESAIFLIILAGIYLMWTKTANWRMIIMTLLSATVLTTAFYYAGFLGALSPNNAALMNPVGKSFLEQITDITKFLFSGSLFYVAVFMATDPVSGPNKPLSQFIYGIIIGSVTILVRTFSGFPEGTSFGILMGNTFANLLDEYAPAPKKKAPKKTAPASAPQEAKA